MKYNNLEFSKYYHIFNRGNNKENIFIEDDNYFYFMKLFEKYILTVAETYAYCLLPNHFHFLLRIRDENKAFQTSKVSKTFEVSNIWQPFSNFFNAYSKAFNKKYKRTGSLFQYKFKRKEVSSDEYFYNLMEYIHQNPQKHRIIDDFKQYKFSSYQAIIIGGNTKLEKSKILNWYDTLENFIHCHNVDIDIEKIKEYIIE